MAITSVRLKNTAAIKRTASKDHLHEQQGLSKSILMLVIASSILNALTLAYVNFLLAWVAFPFLFYALAKKRSRRQSTFIGLMFGGFSSLLLNFWMVQVVSDYAQGGLFMGLLCWIVSSLVLAAFFGLQFYLFCLFKLPAERRFALLQNGLLMAGLWVLFEWVRGEGFSGIPWLSYSVGITQGSSLYLMQPAAYGGVYILSFLIIFSAFVAATAYDRKEWKLLFIPLLVLLLQFSAGFVLFERIEQEVARTGKGKFKVGFVLAALSPDMVWSPGSANVLVGRLLTLNQQASRSGADLIVWSETVVPWTYAPDDDFLTEVIKETSANGVHTLMGMNSAADASGDALWNSVYFLDPLGKVKGRYDKQTLLTFVEKPLLQAEGNLILPFLPATGQKMLVGGQKQAIETPWGKAGVLLCNESTYSSQAYRLVKNGATYLVNMGNDSWFYNSFITRQHFYNARFRAVETRKDVLINNNMGIAGLVRASGEIAEHYDGQKVGVHYAELKPNELSAHNPQYFIYFILAVMFLIAINRLYTMQKSKQACQ